MITHRATLTIPAQEVQGIIALLKGEDERIAKGDTLCMHGCSFPNGFEVDVQLVSCGREETPYLDVVLFDNHGCEVYALAPSFEQVEGSYTWTVGNDTYELTVTAR